MSDSPDASQARSRNAALVCSCIGLLTFGLISPVGLFLGIRDLRQPPPHTRATVAIVLSGLGIVNLFVVAALLVIFAMGFRNYQQAAAASSPKPGELQIAVFGQKHYWTSISPGKDGVLGTADDIQLQNEIVIPEQTRVYISINSNDVIHGLFIPVAQFKKDAVPGRDNSGVINPMALGQYDFFCTEYCGQGHSQMTGTLHVVSDHDYQARMSQPAASVSP